MKLIQFVRNRLLEHSTLGDLAAAATAAALVAWPWSLICFLALLGKAMIPDGTIGGAK